MLEVSMATRSGRNGNEDIAGAASEAFVRWLHHRQNVIGGRGHIVSRRDTLFEM